MNRLTNIGTKGELYIYVSSKLMDKIIFSLLVIGVVIWQSLNFPTLAKRFIALKKKPNRR